MKVLLVVPEENIPAQAEMYPSGAMLLIGTMLKNKGHKVKVLHMTADKMTIDDISSTVKLFSPDIVGITTNTYQVRSAKEISKAVKNVSRSITVVIGGPHPSALTTKALDYFSDVDIVVCGEGENTFLEIVEGHDIKTIQGICHSGGQNLPRVAAPDLDYLPLPDLDLVGPISKFTGVAFKKSDPSMHIMGSRGCPFQCVYCNTSIWGKSVRMRKPELLVEEVKYLYKKYGIRDIYFQDDTFNLKRSWTEEVFSLIIKNNLNKDIFYKTPFRVNKNLVDTELLTMAKAANFWCIFYGVENGDQGMLDRMKKGETIEEIIRAFDLTNKVGIKTVASFMIGNSGETRETVKSSLRLMKRIKPYYCGFGIAIPFPGTVFREELIKSGHLLDVPYDVYSSKICTIRTDELTTKEIERLSVLTNFAATIYCPGNRNAFIKQIIKNPIKYVKGRVRQLLRIYKG